MSVNPEVEDEVEIFMFSGTRAGRSKMHLTRELANPVSLCGLASATRRLDGEAHRKYIHPFKGFEQKPEHRWCERCRERWTC